MTTRHHSEVPIDELRRFEVRQLVPGIDGRDGGPGLDGLPRGLGAGFWRRLPDTWSGIGRVTVGEMLTWHGVGETKVRRFLGWMDDTWGAGEIPTSGGEIDVDEGRLLGAIRDLAAWGAMRGHRDLVTTAAEAWAGSPDAPLNALDALAGFDLRAVAGEERLARWDPVAASKRLIDELDDREREIARHRILQPAARPTKTLAELGDDFGVARERIRQVEERLTARLDHLLSQDRFRAIHRRAGEIADLLGTASPIEVLPQDVVPDDDHLADELLLWVAGPYRVEAAWVVRKSAPSVPDLVLDAFGEVADGDRVDTTSLSLALMDLGVPEPFVERAIQLSDLAAWDEDQLVRWPGTHGDRALVILDLVGRPMSIDEIYRRLPDEPNERSFANAVQRHPDIVRTGRGRYELRVWGGEAFSGIIPEILALLEVEEPRDVELLATELAERFDISENSVRMYADMHPGLITEDGGVRRRREDEPYIPRGTVETEKSCFLTEDGWTLRIPVDDDILRGSGRSIPEAFAAHIGLMPLTKGTIESALGPVAAAWANTNPTFGSLRRHAQELDLAEGDFLFVGLGADGTLFSRGTKPSGQAGPESRLRALIGNSDERPWPKALASAIGYGGAIAVSVPHLRARLSERGNEEILEVLGRITTR